MENTLPSIPAKRYFTIGEVSELCGVKPHVLRYWEQEFTQLRPMKRRGNRRYYQHHEVLMIRRIRDLLYDQGFTISGARNKLQELVQSERDRLRMAMGSQVIDIDLPRPRRESLRSEARFGELVGEDEQGNRYYRTKGGEVDPTLHFERRWVVYNGYAEASRIPTGWHGWIHHTTDVAPSETSYTPREWQKPHQPNLTGTPAAYRPSGSTLPSGRRPKATGDYQAWTPGS